MEEMVALFLPFFIFISYFRPPNECITYIKERKMKEITIISGGI